MSYLSIAQTSVADWCLSSHAPSVHAAEEVAQVLSRNAAGWRAKAPSAHVPARDWLLVFVGDDADEMRTAAAGAATAGFERGSVLEGGLQAYGQAALQQVRWQHHCKYCRHLAMPGLALMSGMSGALRLL